MKHAAREVARLGLTLHIYLSMAGFMLVLFFAMTGFTLNHDNFGLDAPRTSTSTIALAADLVQHGNEAAVVDALRSQLHLTEAESHYAIQDDEIEVTFSAPGRRTQATINRKDGRTEIMTESHGLMGKIGDLHRGAESGPVWKWIIDITAALLTMSSLTGIVTLISLPRRRRLGLAAGLASIVVLAVIYMLWVPR